MLRKNEVWKYVEPLVHAEGVELFDVEAPAGASGVLRIFIAKGGDGVTHAECSAVSSRILDSENVDEIMPGNVTLEVSSPGINRKLSRPEHFQGAVGERIRITYSDRPDKKRSTIYGKLLSFDGHELSLEDEKRDVRVIPFVDVHEARVDFVFG